MRAIIVLFALLLSLYCFGVIVYALYITFGVLATLATIAVPILCANVINAIANSLEG